MSSNGCYHNSKKVVSAVRHEYAEQHGQEVPAEFGPILEALVYTRYPSNEVQVVADGTSGDESRLARFVAWFMENDARYRSEFDAMGIPRHLSKDPREEWQDMP